MEFVKQRDEKEIEESIEIWLEGGMSLGSVAICGRDNKGYKKTIVVLKEGKLTLCTNAQLKGIDTDPEGRIMLGIE